MFHVYKHTFKSTGKSYIGYTGLTVEERLHKHSTNANSGIKTHFYNAIRKYGLGDIITETLYSCGNEQTAKDMEVHYIKEYNTFKDGYNSTEGGTGGQTLTEKNKHSWQKKKSDAMAGEKNSRYIKVEDEEILKKAHEYFVEHNQLPLKMWFDYSSEKYGWPKSYSNFRFNQYGGGRTGFKKAMIEKYGMNESNFKYVRTQEHKEKLKLAPLGKNWYYNESLKQSKQMMIDEVTEGWIKGRKVKWD